jgi:hypothetical protein
VKIGRWDDDKVKNIHLKTIPGKVHKRAKNKGFFIFQQNVQVRAAPARNVHINILLALYVEQDQDKHLNGFQDLFTRAICPFSGYVFICL